MQQEVTGRILSLKGDTVEASTLTPNAVRYDTFVPGTNVPSAEIKASSRKKRTPYAGAGIVGRAREAERSALAKSLTNTYNAVFDTEQTALDYLLGLPNSKWGWINAFLQKIVKGEKVSTCDVQLFSNMWMTDAAKDVTGKFFALPPVAKLMDTKEDQLGRFPTRSNMPIFCDDGVLKVNVKNPGVLNLYSGEVEEYPDYQTMLEEIARYNRYDSGVDWRTGRVKGSSCIRSAPAIESDGDDCECHNMLQHTTNTAISTLSSLQEMRRQYEGLLDIYSQTSALDYVSDDPKILALISKFREQLYEPHLSIPDFNRLVDAWSRMKDLGSGKYLLSLFNPFKHRHARVPSEIPTPSATFSLRSNINLTTNASGNVAFAYSPFYLAGAGSTTTSFAINNDATLTGAAANNFFIGQNIGQALPAPLYNRYRLVSAGIKLTFTSSLLNSTGFATLGFDIGGTTASGAVGTAINTFQQYGSFEAIENSYYKDIKGLRNGESIESLWLPIDAAAYDFKTMNLDNPYGNLIGYISGAPPTTVVARVDIVMNYEALVTVALADYLPCEVYVGNVTSIKQAQAVAASSLSDKGLPTTEKMYETAKSLGITDLSGQVKLPMPKQISNLVGKIDKAIDDVAKNIVDKLSGTLKPEEKKSFLNQVMDFLNPVASSLISLVPRPNMKFR